MKIMHSVTRILAIAEKEWIQVRRDGRSLILSILLPVLLLLLFAYALNMDVKRVSVAIFDQDKSALSRDLLESFSNTEYFRVQRYVRNYREIDDLIDRGTVIMGIVVPRNFESMYKSGKHVSVQILIDGSDSTSATVAGGYVKSIMFSFNRDLRMRDLNRAGISGIVAPVDVRSRVWYNEELQSKNFIVPGIIVIVMAIISALITSLTISREWERGTMETLITTPVRKYEVYFGKLVPYVLIALFDLIITVSLGYFVFSVPLRGSFIELYLIALLFLIGTSSLGIMISSATRSQVLSVQAAIIITYLPSIILSGYIFPIKNMPGIVQIITYLVPAKYLITVMKGIALKGIGASLLWTQIVFLTLYAVVVGAISLKKLSLKLPE
ncbi:MAG TPA: ABC transporter permease [Spirochaetota bacterium]|nr:ABC transporter permease [Spirochaetota bacterium]